MSTQVIDEVRNHKGVDVTKAVNSKKPYCKPDIRCVQSSGDHSEDSILGPRTCLFIEYMTTS